MQKSLILTSSVTNSAIGTGFEENPYACADTQDMIFLPSYEEWSWNPAYGMAMQTSDYARACGARISTSFYSYGCGDWWLRSPHNSAESKVRIVRYTGSSSTNATVSDTSYGIVPALRISLN